jgi:hypothetical protein
MDTHGSVKPNTRLSWCSLWGGNPPRTRAKAAARMRLSPARLRVLYSVTLAHWPLNRKAVRRDLPPALLADRVSCSHQRVSVLAETNLRTLLPQVGRPHAPPTMLEDCPHLSISHQTSVRRFHHIRVTTALIPYAALSSATPPKARRPYITPNPPTSLPRRIQRAYGKQRTKSVDSLRRSTARSIPSTDERRRIYRRV